LFGGLFTGQEPAALTGTVADPLAAQVPNVKLRLLSLDRVLEIVSDNEGHFQFPASSPGIYDLEISSPGFSRQTLHLDLSTGGDRTLDITIQVADTSESCGSRPSTTYLPAKSRSPQLTGKVWDYYRRRPPLSTTMAYLSKGGEKGSVLSSPANKKGTFVFRDLSAGEYDLRIASPGYFQQNLKVLVARENDVLIDVAFLKEREIIICQ